MKKRYEEPSLKKVSLLSEQRVLQFCYGDWGTGLEGPGSVQGDCFDPTGKPCIYIEGPPPPP